MCALERHCSVQGRKLNSNKIVSNNGYSHIMIYAWILLGVLTSGITLLIFIGLRSRSQGYIGMPPADKSNYAKANYIDANITLTNIDPPLDNQTSNEDNCTPHQRTAAQVIETPHKAKHNVEPIDGTLEIESDYEEALIMLREVKAMLLQGRPDRAIDYIRQSSGVNHAEAEEFVRDIESGKIG